MGPLTISKLAQAAGVSVETIRFYQRRGLLIAPATRAGGVRHYGQRDLARLLFIKAAQRIGFTLDETEQLLKLDDGAHCAEARAIAENKLEAVRARRTDLERIEAVLADLVERCETTDDQVSCPLIDALQTALVSHPPKPPAAG